MEKRDNFRDIIYDRLCQDLIGPMDEEEIIDDNPIDQYVLGSLSPTNNKITQEEDDDKIEVANDYGSVDTSDNFTLERVTSSKTTRPSTIGISFETEKKENTNPSIRIAISAAIYVPTWIDENNKIITEQINQKKKFQKWKRKPLSLFFDHSISLGTESIDLKSKGLEGLNIHIKRLDLKSSCTVTVSLVNNQLTEKNSSKQDNAIKTFFQTSLQIEKINSNFLKRNNLSGSLDEDDQITELLFRNTNNYASGHLCSAIWDNTQPPKFIKTSWIPFSIVPDTDPSGDKIFQQFVSKTKLGSLESFTMSNANKNDLIELLSSIPNAYDQWLNDVSVNVEKINIKRLNLTARENLKICKKAVQRMREGISLIENEENIRKAFLLSNNSMDRQSKWKNKNLTWRPFQIGFFLMNISSVAKPDHPERNLLDLLWFPTGGGKTEAYLLIVSFLLFIRRFKSSSNFPDNSLAVIMRYTLRTLTIQQFERASSMIISSEITRINSLEKHPSLKGTSFSIGLWVGQDATPNKKEVAIKNLISNNSSTPKQLINCPCCSNKLQWSAVPEESPNDIEIKCTNDSCEVANLFDNLPVYTVDDYIYDFRPNMIVGTIDKFAQITRSSRMKELFSLDDNRMPIDLIIQDELHLISGPLGSLAGIYEIAIEEFCKSKTNGKIPKIIASTATIRKAKDQIRSLYNKEAFQFPPPMLDAENSCFAKISDTKPGRMYLGVTTAVKGSAKWVLQATCASLLQSSEDKLFQIDKDDTYKTLVGYFNSLRELGGAFVLMTDDVDKTIEKFSQRRKEEKRKIKEPQELTSRRLSSEIPVILEMLNSKSTEDNFVDILLATNMLSVGVDIPRLGLMVVNGQPKTMSEYIQATSRVGRSTPGLIVSIYNNSKIRDKSHYENFCSWHSSLYRDIEVTSVTPFAPRSREKALHAVVVALARNLFSIDKNLHEKDKDQLMVKMKSIFLDRIKRIDPEESDLAMKQIENFLEDWSTRDKIDYFWNDNSPKKSLLISAEKSAARKVAGLSEFNSLGTPNSLRDVEPSINYILWESAKLNR